MRIRKRYWLGGFGLLAVIGLLVAGPSPPLDTTVPAVQLPADLDRYLAASESALGDVTPGAEKTIVWFDPGSKKPTDYSVVYVHGFSASRRETAPLADIVARRLRANLFYTRLRGHGRDGAALADVTVNDWLVDTAEALSIGERLGRRVIVIGVSTGATLATWLASARPSAPVTAFILMSPNFGVRSKTARIAAWRGAEYFLPRLAGKQRQWEPVNEGQRRYWTWSYPTVAVIPMMRLVSHVRSIDPGRLNQPFLILTSPDDRVVDPEQAERFFRRLGSTRRQLERITTAQDPQHHVLAGDILSPGTTDRVAEMILSFLSGLTAPGR